MYSSWAETRGGGVPIGFFEFSSATILPAFASLVVAFFALRIFHPPEGLSVEPAVKRLGEKAASLGAPSRDEIVTGIVIVAMVLALVFFGKQYGLGTIALAFAALLFITRAGRWEATEGNVNWGVALLSALPALAQSPAIPPNTDDGYFVSANYFADFGRGRDAQQLQHSGRHCSQADDDRAEYPHEQQQRRGKHHRGPFRSRQGEILWHHFAEQHVQAGHQGERDRERQWMDEFMRDTERSQGIGQQGGDDGLRERTQPE
jgi:hypothetical protein